MASKRLTPFQEKFCLKYVETSNASRSYIYAYGDKSLKTASRSASNLMRLKHIQERIQELQAGLRKKFKIATEDLIRVNAEVAFSKLSKVIKITKEGEIQLLVDGDIDELDGISFSKSESYQSGKSGISESKTTSIAVRRPDRVRAAQELAKLIGAYEPTSDDGEHVKQAAQNLLESLAKFKKK